MTQMLNDNPQHIQPMKDSLIRIALLIILIIVNTVF